jgi:hypothetical protein
MVGLINVYVGMILKENYAGKIDLGCKIGSDWFYKNHENR